MSIFSKYLVFVTLFVSLVYVFSLFLPHQTTASHQEFIHGNTNDVYEVLKNFEEWKNWNVWNMDTLNYNVLYESNPKDGISSFSWTSKKDIRNRGRMQIQNFSKLSSIHHTIQLYTTDSIQSFMQLTPTDSGTAVQWKIILNLNSFEERFLGYFLQRWLIRDIKKSLRNIDFYLYRNNRSLGYINYNYDTVLSVNSLNYEITDTISDEKLFSTLSQFNTEFSKMHPKVSNNRYANLYYRSIADIRAQTHLYTIGTIIDSNTTLPDSSKIFDYTFKLIRFYYIGSTEEIPSTVKKLVGFLKKENMDVDSSPYINFNQFPVNTEFIDSGNTQIFFIAH